MVDPVHGGAAYCRSRAQGKRTAAATALAGCETEIFQLRLFHVFLLAEYMCISYTTGCMSTRSTPEAILRQIAQIHRMDHGTVSVIRQGPHGPYYNHQCYENGRNVSRYVPPEQVPELEQAIEGYRRFQELVKQYVQLRVEQTRAERQAGSKKKTWPPESSWPKTKKSNG